MFSSRGTSRTFLSQAKRSSDGSNQSDGNVNSSTSSSGPAVSKVASGPLASASCTPSRRSLTTPIGVLTSKRPSQAGGKTGSAATTSRLPAAAEATPRFCSSGAQLLAPLLVGDASATAASALTSSGADSLAQEVLITGTPHTESRGCPSSFSKISGSNGTKPSEGPAVKETRARSISGLATLHQECLWSCGVQNRLPARLSAVAGTRQPPSA
mmetsp:Transcript_115064/g.203931  ORF Transcript_115064/g.203931 Transcript_115064/m.203931 type:complete len:213 (-) Transcript_115064:111-749(-)